MIVLANVSIAHLLLCFSFTLLHLTLACDCLFQTDFPRTFVLEIGSEELPPQDVTSAISQVCRRFQLFPFHDLSLKLVGI